MQRLYAVVFLSGAAGLVYQVVWHKYLAILLGSHSRATAVVLAVFLGGLGAGYALFGGWSARKRGNLLRLFAYIEIALGVYALLFPLLFRLAFRLAPLLDAGLGVNSLVTDLLLSTALIGPPTVLMGGTLPLLTQAFGEDFDAASRVHARIYGWNTVGAALGALACGGVLIPALGLPAAARVGALCNLAAGLTAFSLSKRTGVAGVWGTPGKAAPFFAGYAGLSGTQRLLILIGLLSGFYVLTLETLLIRLMGLSAGSSANHFSLIVSIFILGLGLAPLLARRIARFTAGHLYANQLAVTVLLLALYFSGEYWPYAAHLLRIPLRSKVENYALYQAFLGGSLFTLLIVPVGACGLTLPLCFHLLKDDRETLGHRTGLLYGANTVGSVLGGLLGGYLLFYVADIDTLFKVVVAAAAAAAALAAGVYRRGGAHSGRRLLAGLGLAALALTAALAAPPYEKDNYMQPFREQDPIESSYKGARAFREHLSRNTKHLFYKDGPNTSVGVGVLRDADGRETARSILVNGKSDGSTDADRFTTMMLGHLPALLAEKPERACVIGFGTGVTAGVLTQYDEVRSVDVVEISPIVLKIARMFDAYNDAVTRSPKVAFREMDAFRFLRSTPRRFDIIVSEPSNPWVQGVENLYSGEFYRIAKGRMSRNGVFVQWTHVYSFDNELFRTVLRTMSGEFPYVSVFQLGKGDRAVVGHFEPFGLGSLERANARVKGSVSVAGSLGKAGLTSIYAVAALELMPPALVRDLAWGARPQSLESPTLSRGAARAFFTGSTADIDALRRKHPGYFPAVRESLLARYERAHPPAPGHLKAMRESFCRTEVSALPRFCKETSFMTADDPAVKTFLRSQAKGDAKTLLKESDEMLRLLTLYYSPIARFPYSRIDDRLDACVRAAPAAGALRGECMIRKMILAKMTAAPDEEFVRRTGLYKAWFARLDPASPGYAQYKDIREDPSEERLKDHFKKAAAAENPLPNAAGSLR